ncbi:MAG: DedA family protein [Deltaproteobacteria bacterium]|jgi:membrane protein DedA with SNARE-associated domain|nr:DedA family protein [Deltaproteobacteria bacterium]
MADIVLMQQLLLKYGYLVILGWTFLEGETIVIIAGFLAQKDLLNPWLIALCAFAGSFCSDQVMFALGKYKGRNILRRFKNLEKKSEKVRRIMLKYEIPLILGFRFVYGVRNITPVLLGVSGVSHLKFFLLNMLGASVWALCFTFGGYYFGHLFSKYTKNIAHAEAWLIGFILCVVLVFFLLRRFRHHREVTHALRVSKISIPGEKTSQEQEAAESALKADSQSDAHAGAAESAETTTPEKSQ